MAKATPAAKQAVNIYRDGGIKAVRRYMMANPQLTPAAIAKAGLIEVIACDAVAAFSQSRDDEVPRLYKNACEWAKPSSVLRTFVAVFATAARKMASRDAMSLLGITTRLGKETEVTRLWRHHYGILTPQPVAASELVLAHQHS